MENCQRIFKERIIKSFPTGIGKIHVIINFFYKT